MTEALNVLQSMLDGAGAKAERILNRLTLSAVAFCIVVITALAGAGCLVAALFFALDTVYNLPVALAVTGLVCFAPVGAFCIYLSVDGRQSRRQASAHVRSPAQASAPPATPEDSVSASASDALVAQQLVHCLNDAVEKYPIRSIAAATLAGWAMSQTGIIDDAEM